MSMIAGSKIESLLIEMESDWMPPAFSVFRLLADSGGNTLLITHDHVLEREF